MTKDTVWLNPGGMDESTGPAVFCGSGAKHSRVPGPGQDPGERPRGADPAAHHRRRRPGAPLRPPDRRGTEDRNVTTLRNRRQCRAGWLWVLSWTIRPPTAWDLGGRGRHGGHRSSGPGTAAGGAERIRAEPGAEFSDTAGGCGRRGKVRGGVGTQCHRIPTSPLQVVRGSVGSHQGSVFFGGR